MIASPHAPSATTLARYPLAATPFELWCESLQRRPDDFSWAIFEAAIAAGVISEEGVLLEAASPASDPVVVAAMAVDTADVIVPLTPQRARRAWRRRDRRLAAETGTSPASVTTEDATASEEPADVLPMPAPRGRRIRRRRDHRVA